MEEFEIDNGYKIKYESEPPYIRWKEINPSGLETVIRGEIALSRNLAPDENTQDIIKEDFYKEVLKVWRRINSD